MWKKQDNSYIGGDGVVLAPISKQRKLGEPPLCCFKTDARSVLVPSTHLALNYVRVYFVCCDKWAHWGDKKVKAQHKLRLYLDLKS